MGVRLLLRVRLRERSRGEYERRAMGLLERPRRGERDLSLCDSSVGSSGVVVQSMLVGLGFKVRHPICWSDGRLLPFLMPKTTFSEENVSVGQARATAQPRATTLLSVLDESDTSYPRSRS